MKKSEFKKLKKGDVVTLRTLEEITQLKCYDGNSNGIIDDEGILRKLIIEDYPELLSEKYRVAELLCNGAYIDIGNYSFFLVRQHLKGDNQS